jgi:hypothetical protein
VRSPLLRRAAITAAVVTASVLYTLPAYAQGPVEPPGEGMPILDVIGVYIGIPLGLFLLITAFVVGPGMLRRPRYRPGRPWQHDPVWFAGPARPESALRAATPGPQTGGGVGADW